MFKTFLTRFIKDERGVTAIEYGIIGVALAATLALAFGTSGDGTFMTALTNAFGDIAKQLGS